jgi:hypothetical protein
MYKGGEVMEAAVKTSLVDVFQTYSNLCKEIDLLEIEKDNLENEWRVYHKLMFENPRGGFNGGLVALPLENVAERLDKIRGKHGNRIEITSINYTGWIIAKNGTSLTVSPSVNTSTTGAAVGMKRPDLLDGPVLP